MSTPEIDLTMDPSSLYREEMYTDRRAGTIRMLVPVRSDGSDDPDRPPVFVGQAQLLTPVGALPLSFEIEASGLEEAVAGFPDAAQVAVQQAIEELKEMQREAASSIVLPEAGGGGLGGGGLGGGGLGGGLGGGGLGGGGLGGGGKIQIP